MNRLATTLSRKEYITSDRDIQFLLRDQTSGNLKELAPEACERTLQYFGKTVKLYAPLYLSNYCVNSCPYCGFSKRSRYEQKILSYEEIKQEAEILADWGMQEILLVAGDDPDKITIEYLKKAVATVKSVVPSVSIETAPFSKEEYCILKEAGLDGVTLYQETYDRKLYEKLHSGGRKADYDFRYAAPFRAAQAGIRRIGVGVLLGLSIWQEDIFHLLKHAIEIQKKYWQVSMSVSFPRINPSLSGFDPLVEVSGKDLVRIISVARIVLPQSDLVLSTREGPDFRDNVIGIGITKISAGSRTTPGGYGTAPGHGEQFSICDTRSPSEIAEMLLHKGFQPVWKDWEFCMR